MEEIVFTEEWRRKNAEAMEKAEIWLNDIMVFVPPSLFKDLDRFCKEPNICSGGFPRDFEDKNRIVKWFLYVNILAPGDGRLANIGILTDDECDNLYVDRPVQFAVGFGIKLEYYFGSELKTEFLSDFASDYVEKLRTRTLLVDRALYIVLDDAFRTLPAFNYEIMLKVRSLLPDRHAQFIFDKAIRTTINLRAAFDNNKHALRLRCDAEKKIHELHMLSWRAIKSLAATAKRIENTKSFSKSRVLEKIRKDTEQEAVAIETKVDEIYCDEYVHWE